MSWSIYSTYLYFHVCSNYFAFLVSGLAWSAQEPRFSFVEFTDECNFYSHILLTAGAEHFKGKRRVACSSGIVVNMIYCKNDRIEIIIGLSRIKDPQRLSTRWLSFWMVALLCVWPSPYWDNSPDHKGWFTGLVVMATPCISVRWAAENGADIWWMSISRGSN